MDGDLISKKELLQQTGISYGQLYRWKRKGLIPEDWFIRKSTFTGQETFFPRDRVLARIAKIQSMKSEDVSLDEIADTLSPDLGRVLLSIDQVRSLRLASDASVEIYLEQHAPLEPLVLGELLTLRVLDALLCDGTITAEEARAFIGTMETGLGPDAQGDYDALLVRKLGLSLWMVIPKGCEPRLEGAARIVVRKDLAAELEELKSVLGERR